MLLYDPGATAEMLRSKYIFLVVFDSIAFGAWEPAEPMLDVRVGTARVRIERVLKGDLDIAQDAVLSITLRTYRNEGPRFVAVPGVWSNCEIVAGASFVVFSSAGPKDAAALLTEPYAFAVKPADPALAEVESVSSLATSEMRLPALVAALAGRRENFTVLTARYVASRLRELLYSDASGFSTVLAEAENPSAQAVFRRIVISEAYDDLMMLDPAPPVFIARLLWGSVRMFAAGIAPEFAVRILENYLPNLLGIEGGLTRKSASIVFQDAPQPRQEIETILRSRPELPGRERLLAWLES